MNEELTFKSALLYLYWLMSGADGVKLFDINDPEWKTMQAMRKYENISKEDFDAFINTDFGSQEDQLKKALAVLKQCPVHEKVRALAWMEKVMLADGNIHSRERQLFQRVLAELEIKQEDVTKAEMDLPSA